KPLQALLVLVGNRLPPLRSHRRVAHDVRVDVQRVLRALDLFELVRHPMCPASRVAPTGLSQMHGFPNGPRAPLHWSGEGRLNGRSPEGRTLGKAGVRST